MTADPDGGVPQRDDDETGTPQAPRTGVAGVDAAAERLDDLDAAPLEEHVAIYEDAHRRLQEGLADLDER